MTQRDEDHARDQARAQMASIAEMVAAANMDWERLEELRDMFADHEVLEDGGINPETFGAVYPDEADELAELEETAGDCEDYEDAMRRIYEDPLSVDFRSGWSSDPNDLQPEEFQILLCTGGPAVRLMGELGFNGEVARVWMEFQDWGTPWTQFFDVDTDALTTYAQWHISL